MKKTDRHDESIVEPNDDIIDLGTASVLTQGADGPIEELEDRVPGVGITD